MRGPFLRRVSAIALYLSAFAMLIGAPIFSIFAWILFWRSGWLGSVSGLMSFSLILVQLLFLAIVLSATRLLWLRAQVLRQAVDSPYHALPIVSTLLMLSGELGALFLLFMGAGSGLMISLGGDEIVPLLPELAALFEAVPIWMRYLLYLLMGLACTLAGVLAGWLFLLGGYFFAEFFRVMVDIAVQVRGLDRSKDNRL